MRKPSLALVLVLLAGLAAAPARAFSFLHDYGTKSRPPKCSLPRGLKRPHMGKPDDVMCGSCGWAEGVKADGYCGLCPEGEGILPSRACGKCPAHEIVNKDFRCENPVAKAEQDKRERAAAEAEKKAADEREKKRKEDEKALAACKAKCGHDIGGGCRASCDAQYKPYRW